jgi:hypothetical protein
MKINKNEAVNFLSDVPYEKRFWCNDSSVFSNLSDLAKTLEKMNSSTFKHHVNKEKNDFSSWIYDVVGDVRLADSLREIRDKKMMAKKIKSRIIYLKKTAKS